MKQTIYQMEHSSIEFKKTHTVNIGTMPKDGGNEPKLTLESLNTKLESSIATLNAKVDSNFVYLNKRIDNLEKRLETPPKWFVEFAKRQEEHWKRQEQFNQYVLDVFKRNNLK